MTTILIILLVLAFLSGAELFAVMLAAAALGAMTSVRGFTIEFDGMTASMFGVGTGDQATVLSTIPMFIYAGYLLAEARTADRLVRFANALLGWMPGGLAVVTIMTCALFTTFTGASGVTIVALGGVLMPALIRSGYPEKFSIGMLAGTGSVGLLFPPALPLFIYGTVYGLTNLDPEIWDTGRFLFAGIVPGILLVGSLSLVAVVTAWKLPRQKFELGELGKSFLAAAPELLIPFGVILGLAKGFALPEIAALTVVYVIVLEVLILKMLKPKVLWTISREAMVMVGAIFVIILASTAFTNYLVTAEVPKKLVLWTQQYVESKWVFLLALNLLLLLVGMVMDIFSAIVIVLPLVAPIAKFYGIDPYHLGVIFLLNLEVGYLTPPVGLNLFITSIKFQRPVTEVIRAVIPFGITMLVVLMIVTYVPWFTTISLQLKPPERRSPISVLTSMVSTAIEESKVSASEITLVDANGKPLLDSSGKPVVKKLADCANVVSETQKSACQELFFTVTTCRPDPKSQDPKQLACANKAIATWTVSNMNGDALHPEYALLTMSELALVGADGKPIEWEGPVLDAKGAPVLDEAGDPKTEMQTLVGANGQPITKKVATCEKLSGSGRDTCRAIFVEASNCHIAPPDPEADCLDEKAKDCTDTGSGGTDGSAATGSGSAATGSAAGSGSASEAGSATTGSGSAATGSAAGSGSAATGSAAGSESAATGSADGSAAGSGSAADGSCAAKAAATCQEQAIRACVAEKITSWLEEYPDRAKLE
ncbi:MAG: TRAP transporter large permease [Kofleriaceae bacterium]